MVCVDLHTYKKSLRSRACLSKRSGVEFLEVLESGCLEIDRMKDAVQHADVNVVPMYICSKDRFTYVVLKHLQAPHLRRQPLLPPSDSHSLSVLSNLYRPVQEQQ